MHKIFLDLSSHPRIVLFNTQVQRLLASIGLWFKPSICGPGGVGHMAIVKNSQIFRDLRAISANGDDADCFAPPEWESHQLDKPMLFALRPTCPQQRII